ncbi:MAG TPA: hypothetical protein VGM54_06290 [Chthoniobacter sp.]|jgi:hypothetical protein
MRRRRPLSASIVLVLIVAAFLPGCGRDNGPSGDVQVQALQTKEELDRVRKHLATVEKQSKEKDDAVALAKEEVDGATKQVADKEHIIVEKDAQIATLQKQIAEAKKGEAQVYLDSSKLHQQGLNSTALLHYRQFVAAYPTSPLIADANRAIAELSVTAPKEASARAALIDPHAAEREFQRQFADGFASMEDIATMVRRKSMAEVVKLLGPPNRTYRDNTELGYIDKVIDPTTGSRGTLVIGFNEDQVATLRVGYQGRPIRP